MRNDCCIRITLQRFRERVHVNRLELGRERVIQSLSHDLSDDIVESYYGNTLVERIRLHSYERNLDQLDFHQLCQALRMLNSLQKRPPVSPQFRMSSRTPPWPYGLTVKRLAVKDSRLSFAFTI